ncbi:hypothetical protein CSUI_003516 [Cystoisospora suis]|uniref:Uncharacterized protein n=1 Tax=Cystoisospora suis TaxID=483139 RepID=A0A2C6L4P0_9APIC|nr:hypothetical protein CSUI_003516 [Cystoisospora suis]
MPPRLLHNLALRRLTDPASRKVNELPFSPLRRFSRSQHTFIYRLLLSLRVLQILFKSQLCFVRNRNPLPIQESGLLLFQTWVIISAPSSLFLLSSSYSCFPPSKSIRQI